MVDDKIVDSVPSYAAIRISGDTQSSYNLFRNAERLGKGVSVTEYQNNNGVVSAVIIAPAQYEWEIKKKSKELGVKTDELNSGYYRRFMKNICD